MTFSNLPPGTSEEDPNAPWNQYECLGCGEEEVDENTDYCTTCKEKLK